MSKKQIVNIVNFIRAVEPRCDVDLMEPVVEQIRLMKEYNLRGTFLMQYDTLLLPEYTELLKSLDPKQFEFGVWFETVEPQVEKAGIKWTGRYPWDWHAHCGFSVGYTKEQRERLVDIHFEQFKAVFGYYPRVFGSWFFDTHTIRYASEKYGLDALCNCKEQYGTDGYTLWGGYYSQAYYPSRTNIFMPAQHDNEQLPVPLFRMLGSDPVYQYDFGMDAETGAQAVQGVITLEPVYNGKGGGVPTWVDWFMKENYNGDCLTFGYAQAGQENSFGWSGMKNGLEYQFPLFAALRDEGKITVEPLGETGRRFKNDYTSTPASTVAAHTAYDTDDRSSVWYSSKQYRVNLYRDGDSFRIRDLHVFDEKFPDPFEDTVCEANEATYETLPVADGNRHSGNGIIAGIYFTPENGGSFTAGALDFNDVGANCAEVGYGDYATILREDSLTVICPVDFIAENRIGKHEHLPEIVSLDKTKLTMKYGTSVYSVTLREGTFESAVRIHSENGRITAVFSAE